MIDDALPRTHGFYTAVTVAGKGRRGSMRMRSRQLSMDRGRKMIQHRTHSFYIPAGIKTDTHNYKFIMIILCENNARSLYYTILEYYDCTTGNE